MKWVARYRGNEGNSGRAVIKTLLAPCTVPHLVKKERAGQRGGRKRGKWEFVVILCEDGE